MADMMKFPKTGLFLDASLTWEACRCRPRMIEAIDAAGGEIVKGKWKLASFNVSVPASQRERAKAMVRGHHRWPPPGDYVALHRRATERESRAAQESFHDPGWATVMSDTPDEINDAAPVLLEAEGRVLVHGLGLGSVIGGLLAKACSFCHGYRVLKTSDPCPQCDSTGQAVRHIDVVEIDADVIDLIGPFYRDPRVKIHHDDCATKVWPRGTTWDYAWHDIWTNIAAYNLSDDTKAEHGISYARLHRKFAGRVGAQASWAFEMARQMRREEERGERELMKFLTAMRDTEFPEARLHLIAERERRKLGLPASARAGFLLMAVSAGWAEQWRQAAESFDGAKLDEALAMTDSIMEAASGEGSRPNEEPVYNPTGGTT